MPNSFSRSDVRLDAGEAPEPARTVEPGTPFRILVLGDFSGRANRQLRAPLAGRRPRQVDLDTLDDAIAGLGTSLSLPRVSLHFRDLEDFHPDRVYARADLFRTLDGMRSSPPRTAAPATPAAPSAPPPNLLDNILGEEEQSSAAAKVEDPGDLAAFIDRIMRPHLADRPDKQREAWSAQIDSTASGQMRTVLHHPDFQSLEAAWRSVWMLLQRLDADSELRVYILDATLDELVSGPAELEKLASPADPWGLIIGNFSFGQGSADAARLALFGRMARRAGAPFLAEALPPDGDEHPEWTALRHSALAPWIGLALPRFLLRLPYGRQTSPLDSFPFEEMPESVHTEYLWGNPAFCCALLLGQAFRQDGWNLRPGAVRRIDGLPLHVYRNQGESALKPCAEVLLRESGAELLLDNGLMPLASLKDQDAALLVRFQSIADPPAGLAGQWR